jgi:hypothetical protein
VSEETAVEGQEPEVKDVPLSDEQLDGLESGNLSAFESVVQGAIEPKKAEEKPEEPEEQQQEEVAPVGVLMKDGKHVLPFDVLEKERERAAQAEARSRELEQQLAASKAPVSTEPTEVDLEIVALKERAKIFREEGLDEYAQQDEKVAARLQSQRDAELKRAEQDALEQRKREEVVLAEQKSVVAGNPYLSMYSSDPQYYSFYNKISALEQMGREMGDPRYAGKQLSERVEIAVQEFLAATPHAPKPLTMPSKDDVQKRFDKAIKAADQQLPESLSDIPAGMPPAQTSVDALAAKSGMALTDYYASLSDDDLRAEVRKHA